MEEKKGRILYLDMLRVIATAGVIMIHVSAEMGTQTDWNFFVSYNCLGRFAVPVFFMVSGSLFLNPAREYSIRNLYVKHIWRLMRIFLFWSVLYALRDVICGLVDLSPSVPESIKILAKCVISGPTHFWFLPVMAALYMVVPLMRLVSADKKMTEYFLILWILFSFAGKFASLLTDMPTIGEIFAKFEMHMVVGYSGYFLLGYYLDRWFRAVRYQRYLIYLTGVLAYVFTVFVTDRLSLEKQNYVETYLDGEMLNSFFMALAVFVFVKTICEKGYVRGWLEGMVFRIADCTFGIYIMHMLSFNLVNYNGIAKKLAFSALEIPFLVMVIYAGTFGVVWLIRKVPLIRKKLI